MEISPLSTRINEIFLVAYTSIHIGKNIIKYLLQKKKRVKVLSPRRDELLESLTEEEGNKLDEIILFDPYNEVSLKQVIYKVFQLKGNETISYVISAITNIKEINEESEKKIFLTNEVFISLMACGTTIKRFCLLSFYEGMSNLKSLVTFTSNNKLKYKQYFSDLTEEFLRKSKLKYIILKSVGLVESDKPSSFSVYQGINVNQGQISTATVGRLMVDVVEDSWILPNVTAECVTLHEQLDSPYNYVQGSIRLNQESSGNRLVTNRRIKRFFMFYFIPGTLVLGFYFASSYITQIFERKFKNFFRKVVKSALTAIKSQ